MDEKFSKEMLEAHNAKRAIHGSPPLKISQTLTNLASDWATTLAKDDKFEHRPNNKYGENIYSSFNSDPKFVASAKEAVDSWYNEIKDYSFGGKPNINKTGHFTQVVWKDSKEVGASRVKSKTGSYYIVANYNPPGNVIGAFNENVLPSGSSPKDKGSKPGPSAGSSSKSSAPASKSSDDSKKPQVINLDDIRGIKFVKTTEPSSGKPKTMLMFDFAPGVMFEVPDETPSKDKPKTQESRAKTPPASSKSKGSAPTDESVSSVPGVKLLGQHPVTGAPTIFEFNVVPVNKSVIPKTEKFTIKGGLIELSPKKTCTSKDKAGTSEKSKPDKDQERTKKAKDDKPVLQTVGTTIDIPRSFKFEISPGITLNVPPDAIVKMLREGKTSNAKFLENPIEIPPGTTVKVTIVTPESTPTTSGTAKPAKESEDNEEKVKVTLYYS